MNGKSRQSSSQKGAQLTEYALLVMLICITALIAVEGLGIKVVELITDSVTEIISTT